ncbi:MAG: SpoIIE family protein phosphatase [Desulfocapsaceae bacterium]
MNISSLFVIDFNFENLYLDNAMAKKTETMLTDLGFTADESRTIMQTGVIRSYPSDSIVLHNRFGSELLYIILKGRVGAFAIDSKGREASIAQYELGEYFGGIEFGDTSYATTFKTLEQSSLLELRMCELKSLLPQASDSARRVFENFLSDVEKQGQQLAEAIQQKKAITEILRAISDSPSNLDSLLDTVAENAAHLCQAKDVAIFQVEGDALKMVAKYGMTQLWPIGRTKRMNRDWVTGRAVLDCKTIHLLDLQALEFEYPEGFSIAKKYGHRSVLVVPLMREKLAIGAILIRRFEVNPFTEKQIELLMTFADQASIAIENVRLFNEINQKSRKLKEQSEELAQWNESLEFKVAEQVAQLEQFAKLEHELKLASDIQKSMLPRSIPHVEGYEIYANLIPAKTVGGDFYEFIPLTEDSIAIAIGDVADKGVPAALFMAMVRSFLRAEVNPGVSPKKVLERVNRHLLEVNDEGIFVTILLGILNNNTHQFIYTRAGHELPILIDDRGAVKPVHKGEGQALGVFDTVILDEQSIDLSDNSIMVLYTDGLSDAIDRQNQRFGIRRMLRTICNMPDQSVSNVCDGIFNAVMNHQRHLPQFDDMTAVAVRAITD